jgi:hypothetical protein
VDLLKKNPTEEIPMVVSRDFRDRDDQEILPEIYTQYQIKYQLIIGEFIEVLGQPKFKGDREESRFPDWAVGEHVTVWRQGKNVHWLRLQQEDAEAPIQIVMAKRTE